MLVVVFFFKQKTAYEMRISDWSSDVCSSDLLTGIAGLQPHEIVFLLDEAEKWVDWNRRHAKSQHPLDGLTQINAFFENSTRTLLSFEIAGKRLGADVVNMRAAQSSVKKGEKLIDPAKIGRAAWRERECKYV